MKKEISKLKIRTFNQRFKHKDDCLAFLANIKWQNGFICRKCGHDNWCKGKTAFSRRCTRCKQEESACAHTFYHHCKIPLIDAFRISWYVCNQPDISSYELSRKFNIRQMTCWKFKTRVCECIKLRGGFSPI